MLCSSGTLGIALSLLHSLLILLSFTREVSSDIEGSNYPLFINSKPCIRLKNTINYQGLLCVPDAKGGFVPHIVTNCKEPFKTTCPEFNQGECLWFNYTCEKDPGLVIPLPCCRLKYYAERHTWMEIYYSNQHGTTKSDTNVLDVVEINRKVLHDGAFFERYQKDWPQNVLDGNGERGLHWIVVPEPVKPLPKADDKPLCVADKYDRRCLDGIVNYLKDSYKNGFDPNLFPKESQWQKDHRDEAKIEVTYVASCTDVLVNSKATSACKVLYVRNAISFLAREKVPTVWDYLEAHVYNKQEGGGYELRYAYWSEEDAKVRERISLKVKEGS